MCAKNKNDVRTFEEIVDEFNSGYPELHVKIQEMQSIINGLQPILATEKEHKSLSLMREFLEIMHKNIILSDFFPLRNYYKPREV